MLKKLFLLLCCASCFGMEKPRQLPNEAKSSGLVKLVHAMEYRVKAAKINHFLQQQGTIDASEFNLIAMPAATAKEHELYERFWYHWGQYFLHYARIDTSGYAWKQQECQSKLREITRIMQTGMNHSTLQEAAACWCYILSHQQIGASKKNLQYFLKKLGSLKEKGDGARMAYLLVEEFAAEQERVRLEWAAYIHSQKDMANSILGLANACALRWKREFPLDDKWVADIEEKMKDMRETLTNNDRRTFVEARAKRIFLK